MAKIVPQTNLTERLIFCYSNAEKSALSAKIFTAHHTNFNLKTILDKRSESSAVADD